MFKTHPKLSDNLSVQVDWLTDLIWCQWKRGNIRVQAEGYLYGILASVIAKKVIGALQVLKYPRNCKRPALSLSLGKCNITLSTQRLLAQETHSVSRRREPMCTEVLFSFCPQFWASRTPRVWWGAWSLAILPCPGCLSSQSCLLPWWGSPLSPSGDCPVLMFQSGIPSEIPNLPLAPALAFRMFLSVHSVSSSSMSGLRAPLSSAHHHLLSRIWSVATMLGHPSTGISRNQGILLKFLWVTWSLWLTPGAEFTTAPLDPFGTQECWRQLRPGYRGGPWLLCSS